MSSEEGDISLIQAATLEIRHLTFLRFTEFVEIY